MEGCLSIVWYSCSHSSPRIVYHTNPIPIVAYRQQNCPMISSLSFVLFAFLPQLLQGRSTPTFQPTAFIPWQLYKLNYVGNFVTGGLALACSAVILIVFFLLGGIRKVAFFRHTRVTRPCARMFMQAYERMNLMIATRAPNKSVYRARRYQSAFRALFFVISSMFVFSVAATVLFVYLSIGIFFQAMLIYRTFPLTSDPLSSSSFLLDFIRLWWATIIRYIVPPLYSNTVNYDSTQIYQPMILVFSWLVNLRIDFSSYLSGLACQGSFVAPLELLLNIAILCILLLLVDIDYSILFGPVMNGTYDKHMETCFFTRRGVCGRLREVMSLGICLIYRVIDFPQQFNNAMHYLSTLVTYRTFFAGGDPSIAGMQVTWRHASTTVCDSITFYNAGASKISNIDSGMAIVSTLAFFLLLLFLVAYGAHALYPQHDMKKSPINGQPLSLNDANHDPRNSQTMVEFNAAQGQGLGPGQALGTPRSLFQETQYPSGGAFPGGGGGGGGYYRGSTSPHPPNEYPSYPHSGDHEAKYGDANEHTEMEGTNGSQGGGVRVRSPSPSYYPTTMEPLTPGISSYPTTQVNRYTLLPYSLHLNPHYTFVTLFYVLLIANLAFIPWHIVLSYHSGRRRCSRV